MSNEPINGDSDCRDDDPSTVALRPLATQGGVSGVELVSLPEEHPDGLVDGNRAGDGVARIVAMSLSLVPSCRSYVGPHIWSDGDHFRKPILTLDEAAGMLGFGKKRLANVISEEKARLGRLPDFVCDAAGRMRRRILRDELLEWMRAKQSRRGRPPKR